MNRSKVFSTIVLFAFFLRQATVHGASDEEEQTPLADSEQDARAGPFDIRPTLPTTTSTAKPTSSDPQPLGGAAGLLGGAGLPELGSGAQQSGVSGTPQSSLILGAFQSIITPFNPGMLGSVIGALGGGGNIGGESGGPPGLPSFPIGSKPQS
uniref:Uncharacterized protein n=1 Tax=Anopheles culicifacies TaxID=139723 RepID=A0A182LRH3_9DIPT